MVVNIDDVVNEFKNNQKLNNTYNTYEKYINYRFDFVIRASLSRAPDELLHTVDYSVFDPTQEILLACINSSNHESNVAELREEVKNLTSEINSKRKEINVISAQEEGVRNNIKYLEEIIAIKENFIEETASYAEIRCIAKEKVQKEYIRVNKKYQKMLTQLHKSSKSLKTNSSNGTSKQVEYLNERVKRYEAKIKKMDDVIKIADESKQKLEQYQTALQTSKDRLKTFYEQLNNYIKNKQEFTSFVNSKEKYVKQLKTNLSNLGVLSSIEKSRHNKFSNCIENDDLKKEFLDLRNMRNEVLRSRPKGMFNPKYQKDKNLTKEDIRKCLENDEAIDSIDYLIELKNCENNSELNIVKYIQMKSKETNIFTRCLSTLNIEEIKKLLVHYFVKNVDLKESGQETDDIIAELDESINRYKHTIITINNNFQEFHLSIEKKFAVLKKHYQDKVNTLFTLLQEETNVLTVLKLKQDVLNLKKKVIELEKEKAILAKSKIVTVTPEKPHKDLDNLEASKSGSETPSAKVTVHKNKLKIQKIKSKLIP